MPYVFVSFVVAFGLTAITAYLLLEWWPAVRRERLQGQAAPRAESILRWEGEPRAGWQRIFERLGRRFGTKDTAKLTRMRRRLIEAGHHDPRAVMIFVGAKIGLAVLAPALYLGYGFLIRRVLPNPVPVSIMLGAAGFFFPDFWLRSRIKERQRAIVNALPDVLDLLMVCVEAGMGFDAAVARIADIPRAKRSPLHDELMRMHLETRAGRPRDEALRELGERTGVQDVKSIVSAFIQTEKLGTPLGKTLRVHAESARVQRRHRAEERAYIAPVKMIFPTVFFLMPAFFLVAMGPPLLGLLQLFNAMGGGIKVK